MLLKIEGERGKAVENIHMRVHMGEKIHGKALRGLAELSVKGGGGRGCPGLRIFVWRCSPGWYMWLIVLSMTVEYHSIAVNSTPPAPAPL